MRFGRLVILSACLWGRMAAASEPPTVSEPATGSPSAAASQPATGTDSYLRYSGVATARRSDAFLYGEQHVLLYREGRLAERVVLYTCRDGSPFARKTVTYVEPFAPDFLLEDAAGGMREGIRSGDRARTVFYQGNRQEPEKSKTLPAIQGLVADTGFDEFIRAHWQALMGGQALQLHFLVPSHLAALSFKLLRLRSDTLNGLPVEVIRLKLSGVLGAVLPSIDVSYGAGDHVLIRYEGLSDLRDAAGDNFEAQIDFPPGDRVPGDAEAEAAARNEPLGACQ